MAWDIYKNAHGKHVTTQRPIVLSVQDDSVSNIIHFRCELLMYNEVSSDYEVTGAQFNAYSDSDTGIYECNVAEYCRQYIEESPSWYSGIWCANRNSMYFRKFVVRFNPVVLNPNGTLSVDYNQPKNSASFYAYPINTKTTESLSTQDDYIRIDYFVCDYTNSSGISWFSSSYNRLQTNMPDGNTIDTSLAVGWITMPFIHSPISSRKLRVTITNLDNGNDMVIYYYIDQLRGTMELNVHPLAFEVFYWAQNGGSSALVLLDAAGNLIASEMRVDLMWVDINNNSAQRGNPGKTYKLTDGSKCGAKDATTFIFRNMVGGFDFFTATGTATKKVNISGMTFDRHTAFDRNVKSNFGVMRGQHSATNLWTQRNETFSVFSQPLTRETAEWLEELVASPQAWVVQKIRGKFEPGGWGDDTCLQAIMIDKASFQIYSTEDNVQYIEFLYTLSEDTTTMKM